MPGSSFENTDEFAVYLGIPLPIDSNVIQRSGLALQLAKGYFENVIGYPLEGEHTVFLNGDQTNVAWLPRFPVLSISSASYFDEGAEEEWVAYDLTYIRFNNETGEVYVSNDVFVQGFQNIKIVYKHGYLDSLNDFRIPGLKSAIYEIAALFFNNPGLLSFQNLDDGITRTSFEHLLSPITIDMISSVAKRSASR